MMSAVAAISGSNAEARKSGNKYFVSSTKGVQAISTRDITGARTGADNFAPSSDPQLKCGASTGMATKGNGGRHQAW